MFLVIESKLNKILEIDNNKNTLNLVKLPVNLS